MESVANRTGVSLGAPYAYASIRKCFQPGVRDWFAARGAQPVFTRFDALEGSVDFLQCAAFSLDGCSRHIVGDAIACRGCFVIGLTIHVNLTDATVDACSQLR